ncbi:hypothetical protein M3Y94_00943500 [Aphelenchoides besseyi]|nr:hypothetical protein M3Y94_00943500 [Aphelenchoides besseyi]
MHSTILSSRISTSMYALNGSIERLCDGRTPQMSTSTTLRRSIDRLIKSARLFVDQKSTCFVCRYTSVRLRSGIQKPNKRARDSCCCERWKPVDHSKPSIPIPLYDLSVFFGFLSLILQFTSWLLVV